MAASAPGSAKPSWAQRLKRGGNGKAKKPARGGTAGGGAPPRRASRGGGGPTKGGGWLLYLAWLLLLGGVAAVVGYALNAPPQSRQSTEIRVTIADPQPAPGTGATPGPASRPAGGDPGAARPPAVPTASSGGTSVVVQPLPPVERAPAANLPAAGGEVQTAAVANGTQPLWLQNSQPSAAALGTAPQIAMVLTGLGLSSSLTQSAIDRLPAAITLSFTPYARELEDWMAKARAKGHEVMIDLPMEPISFPVDDPGPKALLTALEPEENLARLEWVLGRASGHVGVAGVMGSRFTASAEHLRPVLQRLAEKGLIFLDNRASDRSRGAEIAKEFGLVHAINDRGLDDTEGSDLVLDARLVQLERIALSEGQALAVGRPYPAAIDRLVLWSAEVAARGFTLVPITGLVRSRMAGGKAP